mmetsp:Transcript_20245/g.56185  ORF Transcript_20245/g.56185 Transcript_20245/m.56185 type:complete len:244 (-) Transcript_20245:1038-1769(-)
MREQLHERRFAPTREREYGDHVALACGEVDFLEEQALPIVETHISDSDRQLVQVHRPSPMRPHGGNPLRTAEKIDLGLVGLLALIQGLLPRPQIDLHVEVLRDLLQGVDLFCNTEQHCVEALKVMADFAEDAHRGQEDSQRDFPRQYRRRDGDNVERREYRAQPFWKVPVVQGYLPFRYLRQSLRVRHFRKRLVDLWAPSIVGHETVLGARLADHLKHDLTQRTSTLRRIRKGCTPLPTEDSH